MHGELELELELDLELGQDGWWVDEPSKNGCWQAAIAFHDCFFIHILSSCPACCCVRYSGALPYELSDSGYDVYLVNHRGRPYEPQTPNVKLHTYLTPQEPEFVSPGTQQHT
jgi:hypothetical protein